MIEPLADSTRLYLVRVESHDRPGQARDSAALAGLCDKPAERVLHDPVTRGVRSLQGQQSHGRGFHMRRESATPNATLLPAFQPPPGQARSSNISMPSWIRVSFFPAI